MDWAAIKGLCDNPVIAFLAVVAIAAICVIACVLIAWIPTAIVNIWRYISRRGDDSDTR